MSRTTDFFAVLSGDSTTPVTATVRERNIEFGLALPASGVRRSRILTVSFVRNAASLEAADLAGTRNRSAVRGSVAASSAHTYGYSVSPENGYLVGATMEVVRRRFGADADGLVATGDARLYARGLARHHVLALRASGGGATGSREAARVFLLGGAAAAPGSASFDGEAFGLLRGFAPDTFAGTRIVLLNADYRLPLWRPQRGIRTWPVFLHTVHAAAFADAGQIWTRARVPSDWKLDVGAELAANMVVGYQVPLTFTAGAAFGHDRSGRIPDGWRTYARIGRAF
jgi:hypothetical protein